MDTAHWLVYLIFLVIEVFGVSFFMEIYKKGIRKNKSKAWENKLIGALLSVVCVAFLHFSGMIYPLFHTMFKAKLWLDYLLYLIVFFIAQWKADMVVVKKAVKILVAQWVKDNAKLTDKQVSEILSLLGLWFYQVLFGGLFFLKHFLNSYDFELYIIYEVMKKKWKQ